MGSECFRCNDGLQSGAAPVQHLASWHRSRCYLWDHHRRGSGWKCHFNEDVLVGEVHADRAQPVPVQPGSGRPAAAGHLRSGGRQSLPGGRVALWPRGMQDDPVHPAHLGGGVRVHPHCPVR